MEKRSLSCPGHVRGLVGAPGRWLASGRRFSSGRSRRRPSGWAWADPRRARLSGGAHRSVPRCLQGPGAHAPLAGPARTLASAVPQPGRPVPRRGRSSLPRDAGSARPLAAAPARAASTAPSSLGTCARAPLDPAPRLEGPVRSLPCLEPGSWLPGSRPSRMSQLRAGFWGGHPGPHPMPPPRGTLSPTGTCPRTEARPPSAPGSLFSQSFFGL